MSGIRSSVVSPRIFGTSAAFSGADGLPRASGPDDHLEVGTGIERGNGLVVEGGVDTGVEMMAGVFRDGFNAARLLGRQRRGIPSRHDSGPAPETWDSAEGCRPETAPAIL